MDSITRMEAIKRRQPIYLPGDASNTVYLLKAGRVKLSRVSEDGKELTLAIMEPGEVFGEMETLEEIPRDTLAEALDDVSLCIIKRRDFEEMLKRDPNTSIRLTKLMGLRLKKIESRIENLVFKDVPARLAQFLLQLSEEIGTREPRGTLIGAKITHQEMANLIGSTRETVSATIGEFKRQGFLDLIQRRVLILDSNGLQKMVHPGNSSALS